MFKVNAGPEKQLEDCLLTGSRPGIAPNTNVLLILVAVRGSEDLCGIYIYSSKINSLC